MKKEEFEISKLCERLIVIVFTFSMIFFYSFSINSVSASSATNEVKKVFDLECDMLDGLVQGIWGKVTLTTTLPEVVAPGQQFQLTNTSLTITRALENYLWDLQMGNSLISDSTSLYISSENVDERMLAIVTDIVTPPIYEAEFSYSIPDEGSIDVGPFTAGQEGNVILKVDQISFIPGLVEDGEPWHGMLVYDCMPGEKITIATIPIDGEAPAITLNGDNPMIVKQGDPYVEPGATAVDNFDGNLSKDDIEISGDVDTSTIGEYTITYTISDSVGNVATAERIVKVVEPFGHWFTGEGAPSDELGVNGDSYVDLLTGDIYKRDPNTWNLVGNIKGDDGNQGSSILTGSGAPSADTGDVGDLYFDTETGDVYEKTEDGWKKIANLQGPGGPQGPQGPAGKGGSGDGSRSGDGSGKKSGDDSKVTMKDGDTKATGGKLPKTATSLPTLILIGAFLATAGGVLVIRRRNAIK